MTLDSCPPTALHAHAHRCTITTDYTGRGGGCSCTGAKCVCKGEEGARGLELHVPEATCCPHTVAFSIPQELFLVDALHYVIATTCWPDTLHALSDAFFCRSARAQLLETSQVNATGRFTTEGLQRLSKATQCIGQDVEAREARNRSDDGRCSTPADPSCPRPRHPHPSHKRNH